MVKRSRVGSKSGVVVKRGAGGRIMGSISQGGHPKMYTIQHGGGHSENITVRNRKVWASSYFQSQRPGQQSHYQSYPNVDRSMAAAALRSARKSGKSISRQVLKPRPLL